jgi:uncharacterized protein DUF6491
MDRVMHTSFRATAGISALLAAASAFGQDGEDKPFDRTPADCITVARIDQTEAIDDQTIIFRMRGRSVYRNTLPSKCPGLERENRIAFQSSTSRLCNIDTITVLEDFGVGFRPGFTCRLGPFVPLSEEEVEDIDLRKKGEAGQRAIETSSVEIERDEAATEPAENDDADAPTPEPEPAPAPAPAPAEAER